MNATLDIRAILDATANQILAVVAPDTARLVRAYVSLDEEADTAATDGVRIWLPPTFEGVDVAHDTPVAVGLLVHELGHFLTARAFSGFMALRYIPSQSRLLRERDISSSRSRAPLRAAASPFRRCWPAPGSFWRWCGNLPDPPAVEARWQAPVPCYRGAGKSSRWRQAASSSFSQAMNNETSVFFSLCCGVTSQYGQG